MLLKGTYEESSNPSFLGKYQKELQYKDLQASMILSLANSDKIFQVKFIDCEIDSSNVSKLGELSHELAGLFNTSQNSDNSYQQIRIIFQPANPAKLSKQEFLSIEELKYTYSTNELE